MYKGGRSIYKGGRSILQGRAEYLQGRAEGLPVVQGEQGVGGAVERAAEHGEVEVLADELRAAEEGKPRMLNTRGVSSFND